MITSHYSIVLHIICVSIHVHVVLEQLIIYLTTIYFSVHHNLNCQNKQ